MSVRKQTIRYAAAAVVVAFAILSASLLYMGQPVAPAAVTTPGTSSTSTSYYSSTTGTGSSTSTSSSTTATSTKTGLVQGPQSLLVIQLTDPPQVPPLTTSLNLTYSSLALLVGEPTGNGSQVSPQVVTLTPTNGSATLDLLKLQNISQTIASATLPNGSVIYSATFTIAAPGISIDVNGTASTVALATGSTTFSVVFSDHSGLTGTNVALLQLNPIVVSTPSGYQLIPSAVAVLQHSSGQGEDKVGSQHQLTTQDQQDLQHAQGNVTVDLTSLSVNQNATSVTVLVNNTGSVPVSINALSLSGNFTAISGGCQTSSGDAPRPFDQNDTNSTGPSSSEHHQCEAPSPNQMVFLPQAFAPYSSNSTTTTTTNSTTSNGCTQAPMSLAGGSSEDNRGGQDGGRTLAPGQCIELTFTGELSFGHSPAVFVPTTTDGQAYLIHLVASNGAGEAISCTLPLGPGSCVPAPHQQDS